MLLKWIQDPLVPFQPQPSQSECKNSQTAASAGQRSAAATTIQPNLTTATVCVSVSLQQKAHRYSKHHLSFQEIETRPSVCVT